MHCTVVTGWWYCYYLVSGTRPHYEWVGFFAHHVGLKSFQKEHFFLDSTWTRFLLKTQNHNSKLDSFFVHWEHTSFKYSSHLRFVFVTKNLLHTYYLYTYVLDAATSSGILKAKQKLGRTFNSNKLGRIAFTKISKLTMCSA